MALDNILGQEVAHLLAQAEHHFKPPRRRRSEPQLLSPSITVSLSPTVVWSITITSHCADRYIPDLPHFVAPHDRLHNTTRCSGRLHAGIPRQSHNATRAAKGKAVQDDESEGLRGES